MFSPNSWELNRYNFQNYTITVIFSLIVGIVFIRFSIIYAFFFLLITIYFFMGIISSLNFEFVFLANCLGFIFIRFSDFGAKNLSKQIILFLILMMSYFLCRNNFDEKFSIWSDNLAKVIFIYFSWILIQLIFSMYTISFYQISRVIVQTLILLGMFYLTSSYIKTTKHLYWILAILLICALLESILGILQHCSPNFYVTPADGSRDPHRLMPREYFGYIFPFISRYVREARGTFGHFNTLGNMLSLFAPLTFALSLIRETTIIRKMFFWLINLIIFFGLYFSYSRGSLSGVLIGLILIILLLTKKRRNKEIKIATVLLLIPLSLFVVYSLTGFFNVYYENTQNLTIRLSFWNETFQHIIESPATFLFGNHYFRILSRQVYQSVVDWTPLGHNSYLAIWERGGIIELILVVILFVFSIKNFYFSFKKTQNIYIKHISIGLIASLIAFSISQLFDHKLAFFYDIQIYFFIILGISIGLKRMVKLLR